MENERWHDIWGYEGSYQISDYGRVKSLARTRKGAKNHICKVREKILKPKTDKDGYVQISLCKNNKLKTFRVHRLVALIYKPNVFPMFSDQINHIDGNKLNNKPENLEWCDSSHNQREAIKLGLKGGKPYNPRIDSTPIRQFDKKGNFIKRYENLAEACRVNHLSKTAICNCLNKRSKSSGGYIWVYEAKNPSKIH